MAVFKPPVSIDNAGVSLRPGQVWTEGFEDRFLDARLLAGVYPRLGEAIWRVSDRACMSAMAATSWWALAACGPGVDRIPVVQQIDAAFVASVDPSATLFNDDSLEQLPDIQLSTDDFKQKLLDLVGYFLSNGHWALTEGEGSVQDAWYGLSAMLCSVVADPTPIERWLERVLARLIAEDSADAPTQGLPPPPQFFAAIDTAAPASARAADWRQALEQLSREPNPFLRDPAALLDLELD